MHFVHLYVVDYEVSSLTKSCVSQVLSNDSSKWERKPQKLQSVHSCEFEVFFSFSDSGVSTYALLPDSLNLQIIVQLVWRVALLDVLHKKSHNYLQENILVIMRLVVKIVSCQVAISPDFAIKIH